MRAADGEGAGVTPQLGRLDLVSQMDVVQDGRGRWRHGVSMRAAVEEGDEHPRRYEFAEEWATGLRPEHMLDWLYSDLHRRRDVLAKAR